jgi:hypothetical protein
MLAIDVKGIRRGIKKYLPILREAREANRNEAETVMIATEFLKDVLGYDIFKEISKEFPVKDKSCDLALKIEGQAKILVEAKPISNALHDKNIEQAEMYGSRSGIPWVILTNGAQWHLYHLTFNEAEGIDRIRVLAVDLLGEETNEETYANQMAILHRDSVASGELEILWKKFSALEAKGLVHCLFSVRVLSHLRREVRRETGILIPFEEIAEGLKNLLDKSTLTELADIRIHPRRRARKHKRSKIGSSQPKLTTAEAAECESSTDAQQQNLDEEVLLSPDGQVPPDPPLPALVSPKSR